GLLRLRHHRRHAHQDAIRRDHLGGGARVPRARCADHQGSAQLPRRLIRTGQYNAIHRAPAELPRFWPVRFYLTGRVSMHHQRILILDYGSQVTQLIARRVREAGVYSEIHPGDVDDAFVREQAGQGLKGIILSGSHASAYAEDSLRVPAAVFDLGVPVLGICYGMQSMAQQLGGKVRFTDHREFGYAEVRAHGHTRLLDGLADFTTPEGHGMLKVWMSHGDKVTELPPGFKLMASTPSCPIAGMADE